MRHRTHAALALVLALAGCRAKPPGRLERAVVTAVKRRVTVGGRSERNPFVATEENVRRGQRAFSSYCAACHGLDGQNTGVPFADAMSPPVPRLNGPDVQQYTDGQLHSVIENGLWPSGMPAARGLLNDPEIWWIVLYIRHLPPAGSLGAGERGIVIPGLREPLRQWNELGHDSYQWVTVGRTDPLRRPGERFPGAFAADQHLHAAHADVLAQGLGQHVLEQMVLLEHTQGIARVLGVSNYYDYDVYADFVRLSRAARIFPLFGLEIIALIDSLVEAGVKINDPGNPGKIYICGKGISRFAPMNAEAQRLIGIIRQNDSQRMAKMIGKLSAVFAERSAKLDLDEDAVD